MPAQPPVLDMNSSFGIEALPTVPQLAVARSALSVAAVIFFDPTLRLFFTRCSSAYGVCRDRVQERR